MVVDEKKFTPYWTGVPTGCHNLLTKTFLHDKLGNILLSNVCPLSDLWYPWYPPFVEEEKILTTLPPSEQL